MQCSESHDYMSMHLHCSCRRGTGDGEAAAAAGDGAPAQEKHGKSTSERVGRTRRPLPRRRPPPPSRPRRPRMRAIWPVAGKQACGRARARAASEPPGHAMQASWLRSGAAGRHLEVKELVAQQLAAVLPGSVCRPRPDACDRARECFWRMDDRAKQVIETQHSSIRMGNREWSGRRRRHLGERGGGPLGFGGFFWIGYDDERRARRRATGLLRALFGSALRCSLSAFKTVAGICVPPRARGGGPAGNS
jgi:hypothetical protein